MNILSRTVFQLVCILIVLAAAYIGAVGAESSYERLFGVSIETENPGLMSPHLWAFMLFFLACVWLSGMGALMSVVIPMAIMFPKHAKPFNIFISNANDAVKLLNWYANGLKNNAKYYESSSKE